MDGLIQNATVSYDGEHFTYKDVCARWQGDCFENDILNLDYVMDDVSIIANIESNTSYSNIYGICDLRIFW